MLDFKIDEEKCIECALCAQDCPVGIIEMNPKPIIRPNKEKNCLKCQHCLAICPTAAVSILGKKPENSIQNLGINLNPEDLGNLIKTRRSIRKFKEEEIDKTLIDEVLDVTSYAPTGHNDNAVLLSLIDKREDLEIFRERTYESIKKAKEDGTLEKKFQFLSAYQKLWENKGVDILFHNAPHVIVASAPENYASPIADCLITLSYFEIIANTYEIGTLWNGLVKWTINDVDPELKLLLGIPENHKLGYVMLFGKSAVKYPRSIQSEGLNLNRVKINRKDVTCKK